MSSVGNLKSPEVIKAFFESTFPDEGRRKNILSLIILTYGLKLETISTILNEEPETLKKHLLDNNDKYHSLTKLFLLGYGDQEEAKSNFYGYFIKLYLSYTSKNRDSIKNCLLAISDSDALAVQQKHKDSKILTDDDIMILVKFQLKYFYTREELASIIGINARHYSSRVNECLVNYPELRSQYEYLADHFKATYCAKGPQPNV